MKEIISRMANLLEKRKIKIKDLAKECNVAPCTISIWKSRDTMPPADIALKIADFLGVSLRWLVFGEEDTSVPLTQEQKDLLEKWGWLDSKEKDVIFTLLEKFKDEHKKTSLQAKKIC